MSECDLKCLPDVNCERCKQGKAMFEGESCALLYNEDEDWFNDEDEEFVFMDSNQWFEEALIMGLREREDIQRGYLQVEKSQLNEAVARLVNAVNESLYAEEYGEKDKNKREKQ